MPPPAGEALHLIFSVPSRSASLVKLGRRWVLCQRGPDLRERRHVLRLAQPCGASVGRARRGVRGACAAE